MAEKRKQEAMEKKEKAMKRGQEAECSESDEDCLSELSEEDGLNLAHLAQQSSEK